VAAVDAAVLAEQPYHRIIHGRAQQRRGFRGPRRHTHQRGEAPMSVPKLPLDPQESTGPSGPLIIEMGGRRQVQLSRTKAGFYELALAGPTKPSSAWGDRLVVHGKLQLSAERALEILTAIAVLCARVDREGLPS
jgi:hypothetical protein